MGRVKCLSTSQVVWFEMGSEECDLQTPATSLSVSPSRWRSVCSSSPSSVLQFFKVYRPCLRSHPWDVHRFTTKAGYKFSLVPEHRGSSIFQEQPLQCCSSCSPKLQRAAQGPCQPKWSLKVSQSPTVFSSLFWWLYALNYEANKAPALEASSRFHTFSNSLNAFWISEYSPTLWSAASAAPQPRRGCEVWRPLSTPILCLWPELPEAPQHYMFHSDYRGGPVNKITLELLYFLLDKNFLSMKWKRACSGTEIQSQAPSYICTVSLEMKDSGLSLVPTSAETMICKAQAGTKDSHSSHHNLLLSKKSKF